MASEEAQDFFEQGMNFLAVKNYGEALTRFNLALQKDPNFFDAWSNKGACHYVLEEYSEALKAFNEAIAINNRSGLPKDFDLLYNSGAALFYLNKQEESIARFRKALDLAKQRGIAEEIAMASNWLAWVLSDRDEDEEAFDVIELAYELEPENSDILDTRGLVLFKLSRYEEATLTLDKAIGKKPTNKYAWYNKGSLLLKQGRYNEAERCYDRALLLDKRFAEAFHGKGLALMHLKKEAEAIQAIKKAIELKPNLSDAHENLTKILSASRGGGLNFWDFWNKTNSRKAVAIALAVFAFGSIIYYPMISMLVPNFGSSTTETNITSGGSITNSTIARERSSEIPQYHLAIIGLAILVFLIPSIRSFKFGPLEVETLTEPKPLDSPP